MTSQVIDPAGDASHTRRMPLIPTSDHTNLFVTEWGDGSPVVLVHAWALNSNMWVQQIPALVDAGYRCIAFDRRGHGRSDAPANGYDLDTLADDLAALVTALDLRGVTLVAHSLGAAEAVRYVSRHHDGRVDRLVLSAPITPMLRKSADNPNGVDGALLDASRAAMQADIGTWVEANADPYFGVGRSVSSLVMEWTKRQFIDTPLPVLLATQRTMAGIDVR